MRHHTLGLKSAAAMLGTLALSGCDLSNTDDEKEAAVAEPAGDGWLIVEKGQAPADDPKPAFLPRKPEVEEGFLKLPETEEADVTAHDARCTGSTPQAKIAPLTVTPGATTATVTWYHPGDPVVTTYRVTAISQDLVVGAQPDVGWQEKTPGEGCHELTATITGLQRATSYVFSVDAVRAPTWTNTTRAATVARSAPVTTN